jgi:Protein of unknown function (DUF1629)
MNKPVSPYNLNYIQRPFDSERKRFYFAVSDLQKVGDYKVLNKGWLNEYGGHTSLYPKTEQIRVPAGKNVLGEDAFFDYRIGLKALDETPQIKVSLKKKPIDIYGACTPDGPFFVSTRAKLLFEQLDPDAFTFVPCETTTRRTLEVDTYWHYGDSALNYLSSHYGDSALNYPSSLAHAYLCGGRGRLWLQYAP